MGTRLSAQAHGSQSFVTLVAWLGSVGTEPRKSLKYVHGEDGKKGHGPLEFTVTPPHTHRLPFSTC